MVKYVRIIAGEYAGELGIVENQSTSGKLFSVTLANPDGAWNGVLLTDEDVLFLSKKMYFKAKLCHE